MKILLLAALTALTAAPAGTPPVARGTLKFRIASPPEQSVPRELTVRVRPTLGVKGLEDHPWQVNLASPVRNGECSCEIPAGQVDLRIEGAACMPVYRWGELVEPERTADLGTLKLERGASISGRVRTLEEKVISHSVLVTLVPLEVGESMTGLDPKYQRTLNLEAMSRPWGFFRFDRVLPGRYEVLAKQPGLPTAHFGPIMIEGDHSFELPEPLWITPLRRLDIQVSPATGPRDKPWDVQLLAEPFAATDGPLNLKGPADSRGQWQRQSLPEGDYKLGVGSAADNWWKVEKIHIGHEALHWNVSLPFFAVAGQVTLRGQPVQTAIAFEHEDQSSAFFRADGQGRFTGFLPQEGSWKVRLTSARELKAALRLADPVRVRKTLSGPVRVDIQIPDTLLPVEVVNELGESVPKSWVNVLGKFRGQALADDFGRTDFIGLKPGRQCLLAARAEPLGLSGETAAWVHPEGQASPLLSLVVPRTVDIRGRVLPRYGFAPGALVLGWPADAAGPARALVTRTDEDGDFRLPLLRGTERAHLAVLAPGSALRILETGVARNLRLDVRVDTPGGTLLLDLPDEPPIPDLWDGEAHRNSADPCGPGDRILTMLRILRKWADLQGTSQTPGHLVVPNVEPGTYTLCATDKSPVLRPGGPPEGDPRCVGGVLKSAGELALKLPAVAQIRHD